MELLVLIDQGIGLINGFSVRVGRNRCVGYAERWEWGILRVAVQFSLVISTI